MTQVPTRRCNGPSFYVPRRISIGPLYTSRTSAVAKEVARLKCDNGKVLHPWDCLASYHPFRGQCSLHKGAAATWSSDRRAPCGIASPERKASLADRRKDWHIETALSGRCLSMPSVPTTSPRGNVNSAAKIALSDGAFPLTIMIHTPMQMSAKKGKVTHDLTWGTNEQPSSIEDKFCPTSCSFLVHCSTLSFHGWHLWYECLSPVQSSTDVGKSPVSRILLVNAFAMQFLGQGGRHTIVEVVDEKFTRNGLMWWDVID